MIRHKLEKGNKMPWEKHKDKGRTSLSESGFYATTRWRKIRNYIIHDEPLCRECLRQGRVRPARLVDHIIAIDSDSTDELKFGEENLQPLCCPCHNKKTKTDNSKFSEANKRKGRDLMDMLESKD